MKTAQSDLKRFILIDDDPLYQFIMVRIARKAHCDLDVYDSILNVDGLNLLGRYDAAIVDYDLGDVNGVEIASYLSAILGDVPVILVSGMHRKPKADWPRCIRRFVNKSSGFEQVLHEVQEELDSLSQNPNSSKGQNYELSQDRI